MWTANKKYRKALTFSFDDGITDDIRLIGILNKYGLKGTFNLNSGLLSDINVWYKSETKDVHHINITEHMHLYDGHEVASHTVTHGLLIDLPYETIYNEYYLDKLYLEALFGYKIKGVAFPYAVFDENTIKVLRDLGIVYARPCIDTYDFSVPTELPVIHSTCHFKHDRVSELADKFLSDDSDEDKLFYIWGHSYELMTEAEWINFEKLCSKLSGQKDVYYCTNIQAIENYLR